jgi:simple sugar transport system substrate-binding protein
MPADIANIAKKTEAAISSGKLHPFQGPVISQDGKVMAAAGSVIDDGTLLSMDWYVEGVEGKLPKKGE